MQVPSADVAVAAVLSASIRLYCATGTRYAIHQSSLGRRHTPETCIKISRRMKEVHAARKAAEMCAQPEQFTCPD